MHHNQTLLLLSPRIIYPLFRMIVFKTFATVRNLFGLELGNPQKNLGIFFKIHDSSPPTISTQESNPVLSTKACRFLHYQTQMSHAQDLTDLPDQGKVARSLSADLYANECTWQFNGLNTHFKDWRFIHRARLNRIPLNAPKSHWSNTSPRCHHCNSKETLPHVLCHCNQNMVAIRQHHNSIVQ